MSEENSITSTFDVPEVDDVAVKAAQESENGVADEAHGAITYAFIGSGQGGSRIAEAFYNNFGYKKCIVVNTAEHDLKGIAVPEEQKLLMKLDDLAGAGKNMDRGAEAARKYEQDVFSKMKKIFGKCDRIMVCIGAGGGTGGGSVFHILRTAHKYLQYIGVQDVDQRIGVICSIPENSECSSPKVAENAIGVLEPLCEYAENNKISPLLIVDNNKIRKLYPNLTMKTYWPTVNKTIAGLFNVFNVMAKKDSEYTSFDSADYNSIMSAGGCLIMGATKVKNYSDKESIGISIKSNLERTLLAEGFSLSTTKRAGSIVIGGDVLFNAAEGLADAINNGFGTLANITGGATIYRGVYSEKGDKITVYNILTGLSRPTSRIEELRRFTSSEKSSTNIYGETKS
jgi:cell division GTPase FtsZ